MPHTEPMNWIFLMVFFWSTLMATSVKIFFH